MREPRRYGRKRHGRKRPYLAPRRDGLRGTLQKVPIAAVHEVLGFADAPPHTAADPTARVPVGLDSFNAEKVDGDVAVGFAGG